MTPIILRIANFKAFAAAQQCGSFFRTARNDARQRGFPQAASSMAPARQGAA